MRAGRMALAAALALTLTACGAPGTEETPAPAPETSAPTGGVSVYTDWSRLTPREKPEAVGGRWYEDDTDVLLPRDDYGTLIPFAGVLVSDLSDPWIDNTYRYGLMTMDGRVVVDPVYTDVSSESYSTVSGEQGVFPAYILSRTTGEVDEYGYPVTEYALAAADGSWCTEFYPSLLCGASADRLLLRTGEVWELRDQTGALLRSWSAAELDGPDDSYHSIQWCAGKAALDAYDGSDGQPVLVLDGAAGELEHWTREAWDAHLNEHWPETDEYTCTTADGATVIEWAGGSCTVPYVSPNEYIPWAQGGIFLFLDERGPAYRLDGTELVPPDVYPYLQFNYDHLLGWSKEAPLRADEDGGGVCFLDQDGQPVFRIPAGNQFLRLWNGVAEVREPGGMAYYRLSDGTCIFRAPFYVDGD